MNVLKTFFDICLLQARPQDVPFSYSLLAITVVGSIVSYILALGELTRILGEGVSLTPITVAEHLLFAATVWLILKFRNRPERFVQTITAMFGVNTIIQLIMWPVTGWLLINAADFPKLDVEQGSPEAGVPVFLMFTLGVWILVVYAHIFRDTLETKFFFGLLYTLASWMVTRLLLLLVFDVMY